MSAESWLEEFYPVEAEEVNENTNGDRVLLEHALRKWRGLRLANLHKHGVSADGIDVVDAEGKSILVIDSTSCTLCIKYLPACHRCPLYRVSQISCCGGYSPYEAWCDKLDPEPMIALIEEALSKV